MPEWEFSEGNNYDYIIEVEHTFQNAAWCYYDIDLKKLESIKITENSHVNHDEIVINTTGNNILLSCLYSGKSQISSVKINIKKSLLCSNIQKSLQSLCYVAEKARKYGVRLRPVPHSVIENL